MENHETFRPKKWSLSLTGGDHLLEVPICKVLTEKFWCFGYRQLLMGGGCLQKVVVYESSTIIISHKLAIQAKLPSRNSYW